MTILEQISDGLNAGRLRYRAICEEPDGLSYQPYAGTGDAGDVRPELALADNIDYMKTLLGRGYAGRFRSIYIDPPFFTKSKFNASVSVRDAGGTSHRIRHLVFDDRFESSLSCYIENMTVRLLLMRDLLAADGLMWVHLDWHSSHYIRIVLDELFGEKNFVNEIVWCYKSGGSGKKHFSRKHDTILVYSRSPQYHINIPAEKSYNRGYRPYNFKGVKEYCDDNGWYTLVNMKDVWNVDMVGRTSSERNGYATQKPLELMRRIIEAGSEEGDLVGDFFCGSGSFLEAAWLSGRRWIGCDNEKLAVSLARKRLMLAGAEFTSNEPYIKNTAGRVDVTVTDEQQLEDGRRLIKACITDFAPDIDTGYIQMRDRQYIEEAAAEAPVQLIDHILADDDYDGTFRCRRIYEDAQGGMIFITSGRVRLVVVDVFGREYDGGVI